MKRETTQTAKTVEQAVAQGAEVLGVAVSAVQYEVIEEPKKGFLGLGAAPAKVLVSYTETNEEVALAFVHNLITDMELQAEVSLTKNEKGESMISISGENAGILIGHHGDTLDALQYLVNLAANHKEDEDASYTKICVDVENYRAKREETLRQLATRMAGRVIKYKKSMTLEPMNPYERRIIHSEIQKMTGVSTNSIGAENNRRIVIYLVDENGTALTPKDGRNDRQNNDRKKNTAAQNNRSGKSGGKQMDAPKAEVIPQTTEKNAAADVTAEKTEKPTKKDRPERSGNNRSRSSKPPRPTANNDTVVKAKQQTTESEQEKADAESGANNVSVKKPYYMRPRNVSTRVPAGTQRTYQKPVKKESVESYFFDLENSDSGLHREKEEPSDIAKACGIYDDPVTEQPKQSESSAEKE